MSIPGVTAEAGADYENLPEDQLFDLLGSAVHSPEVGLVANRALTLDDVSRPDGARELGQRIFSRWSKTLHDFLCSPSADDKDLADKVWAAVTKQGGVVAALAAALVSAFGLAPATAAIIAALVMKLVFKPAGDEICKFWGEKLGNSQ